MEAIFKEGSILLFLNSFEKAVVVIDTNGNVTFINRAGENLLDKGLAEIRGRNFRQYMHFDMIDEVLSKGLSITSASVWVNSRIRYINMCPISINRNTIGAVIVLDNTDNSDNFVSTFRLSNGINRELESVFNACYDEVFITDGEGNVLKVNAICEKLYNLQTEDLVGRNVRELEKRGVFCPSVTIKVIRDKKMISLTQRTNSGKVLIVTGNPVFDGNGKLVQVISTSKDITEIHELQQALKETKELAQTYYNQLEILKQNDGIKSNIIYKSLKMEGIMALVEKIARVDSNVLISGESGVGKGLIAETIHKMSKRSNKEFVSINCGAIPETLLESELFGYERGAFTGARKDGKTGLIELADKGTLFLDEISELPIHMQVKLLKVVNEKKFMRIGGVDTKTVDVRIIAATNRDLNKMICEGRFREDLYYRLNVIPLYICPLRERKEDIIVLAKYFVEKLNLKYSTNIRLSKEVFEALLEYDWPGNVRELENCIERLVVTADNEVIDYDDLPGFLSKNRKEEMVETKLRPLKEAMEQTEKQLIVAAYNYLKNTYKIAEVLGISQPTVVRKLKKYLENDCENCDN
ncbi:MAG: sigma 54-interacting transcriptional regulator, partial [Firmicutes bacterium]|nr:sigma 54-interacting transcriptional regulator [Bacillota bacterium]